ncbi:DDRGK domain-containing protein 1-like isoform X2 [Haliotis rufescens]|uniref:DDRGK domain-containing protein 1-like isoform X2 n=1 Tax=Haliotis rufescens TaxID=6454 RepID=UPI00201F8E22|nr:DDRGK domain-containing protein 1-like isoform X2 [Haliotis rufescens]
MAVVDQFTIYIVTASVVALILLVVTLINKFSTSKNTNEREEAGQVNRPPPRAAEAPPGARRRGPRRRMRLNRDDSDEEMFDGDDDDIADTLNQGEGKVGAKKLKKLQEKAEKRAAREQEMEERADRKKREALLDEQRKKDDEREKLEEAAREEEEKKIREEKERQEHEEYLKLKEMFSVEEEGQDDAVPDLSSESLLQEFISYIKDMKVVILEDLAAHFKLKTQDVIQRVQDLQAEGQLTGVVDDRGKFIYITMDELEDVAKYIRQHGRVSITDLAESSNRLINLNPENTETHKKLVSEVSG